MADGHEAASIRVSKNQPTSSAIIAPAITAAPRRRLGRAATSTATAATARPDCRWRHPLAIPSQAREYPSSPSRCQLGQSGRAGRLRRSRVRTPATWPRADAPGRADPQDRHSLRHSPRSTAPGHEYRYSTGPGRMPQGTPGLTCHIPRTRQPAATSPGITGLQPGMARIAADRCAASGSRPPAESASTKRCFASRADHGRAILPQHRPRGAAVRYANYCPVLRQRWRPDLHNLHHPVVSAGPSGGG